METGVRIGLYGKHPEWGDFIAAGLSPKAEDLLQGWLTGALPQLREAWGDGWEGWYDASPVIRFWFGEGLVERAGPLTGILVPSRDKVGRRFPLVIAVEGAEVPAPALAPDGGLHGTLWQALEGYARGHGQGAADLAFAIQRGVGDLPAAAEPEPGFWAARADGNLDQLWADVAAVDHARATALRSYLWVQGRDGAAVHVCRGLPEAAMLGWLMTDAVGGAGAPEPPAAAAEEPAPAPEPDTTIAPTEQTRADGVPVPPLAPIPDWDVTLPPIGAEPLPGAADWEAPQMGGAPATETGDGAPAAPGDAEGVDLPPDLPQGEAGDEAPPDAVEPDEGETEAEPEEADRAVATPHLSQ